MGKNAANEGVISPAATRAAVYFIRTDEERMIVRGEPQTRTWHAEKYEEKYLLSVWGVKGGPGWMVLNVQRIQRKAEEHENPGLPENLWVKRW